MISINGPACRTDRGFGCLGEAELRGHHAAQQSASVPIDLVCTGRRIDQNGQCAT